MWIKIKSSFFAHLKRDPWWVSLADGQVSFLTKIESVLIHGMFLYQYRLYFSKERNLPAGQRYPPWGPLEMSKRRRFSPIFLGENSLSINSTLNVLYDDLFFLQSGTEMGLQNSSNKNVGKLLTPYKSNQVPFSPLAV